MKCLNKIKQTISDDVVELSEIIKSAINKEGLDTIVELYDCYRFLCDANKYGFMFLDGHFKDDINDAYYQNTKYFSSPILKWEDYSQRELKTFNTSLLKFIRGSAYIGYKKDGYYDKIFQYNFTKYTMYIPYPEYDNKLKISKKYVIKEEQMKFNYEPDNSFIIYSDHELIDAVKHYDIKSLEQRTLFIKHMRANLKKLTQFKLYLEKYMLTQDIPNTLFMKE